MKDQYNAGEISQARQIWLFFRPAVIYLISFAAAIAVVYFAFMLIMTNFVLPVDKKDTAPIVIEVKSGSSTSSIANLLFGESDNNRLIRNKAAFKIYVDFTGKGQKLKAGKYEFSKSMTYNDIVNLLVAGSTNTQKAIKFTLTEGSNAADMANALVNQGVVLTPDKYLEIAKTAKDVQFELPENHQKRTYALEGYLFPDTYEVFEGASEDSIIKKQLARFNDIFTAEYIERANELDMSVDDIITLASIIEREAKTAQFKQVSAVFHNRQKDKIPLESCATVQYALGVHNYVLSKEQLSSDSLYNTYKYPGLPVGPISNPGKNSIEAALYPDEEFLKEKYLFFCLKEPDSGELIFAKTKKQHDKNVSLYRDQWLAYDDAREQTN